MGLMMSIILRLKEKDEKSTAKCLYYTGSHTSVTFSLLGGCFLFAFFPGLLLDRKPDNVDSLGAPHTLVNGSLSIWYAMASSLITGSGFNGIINNKLNSR